MVALINKKQSYRDHIQELIKQMQDIYEDCEWLRDCATGEEKDAWNKTRGIMYEADKYLRKLDKSYVRFKLVNINVLIIC
jgi:hypothetical protein